MSSKDRFEKTFSRKKKENTSSPTTAAAAVIEKKRNHAKNKTGEKKLVITQPKQKHPSQTPSSKNQTKSDAKPTKITILGLPQQPPTNNKSPKKKNVSSGSVKHKLQKPKPEKEEILNKEKKRKAENQNVGQEKDKVKTMKPTTIVFKVGKKEKEKEKEKEKDEEEGLECAFPTARITRIVKSEGSDCKITGEAVFLINKATEKFIELFSEDAYGFAVEDHKSFIGYKHLSSAVSKGKLFDFLSDFVPEKVTAEKALAERNPPETLPG